MSSTVSCSSAAAMVRGPMPEVGEDLRDGDRVRDVRLAALAHLPGVRALGDGVGALDEPEVGLRMVRAHRADQRVDGSDGLRLGEDPRHQGAQRGRSTSVPTFSCQPWALPKSKLAFAARRFGSVRSRRVSAPQSRSAGDAGDVRGGPGLLHALRLLLDRRPRPRAAASTAERRRTSSSRCRRSCR